MDDDTIHNILEYLYSYVILKVTDGEGSFRMLQEVTKADARAFKKSRSCTNYSKWGE
jgi:hypothetical protein